MHAPGWGFAGELHEDDGGFALASKGLQDKEANTLMQSLTQFESAVYGEVKLPAAKKTLKKIAIGKIDRYRGIPADGQSTRPLKVQVDEWKSAFLHLRVRGNLCACPSQESGWQWHEPHSPAQASTASSPVAKVVGFGSSAMKAPFPERNPISLRVAAKVAGLAASQSSGRRSSFAAQVNEKPARGSRGGNRNSGAASAAGAALKAAVLPPPPELRLDGASVPILPPPMAEDGHEPEEVFAQHGEFQEVYAQHTDNWAITKKDLSAWCPSVRHARKKQEWGSRRRNQRRQAASAEMEEARRSLREAEAGMPPVEPVAAAQNEAKEILFDTVWANLCPMLAPLLSGMHRSLEEEEEEEEEEGGSDGSESMYLTQEGSQVMTFDNEEPPTEVPGYSEGNAEWPPPLVEEPAARKGEQLGAMEHSRAGTGFKLLQHRRSSAGDMLDHESLCADGLGLLRPPGSGGTFSSSRPPSGPLRSLPISRHSSRSLGSLGRLGTSSPVLPLVPSRPSSGRSRTPRPSADSCHSIDGSSSPIAMVLSREPAGRLGSPSGSGRLPSISPPQITGTGSSAPAAQVNLSLYVQTEPPPNSMRRSSHSDGMSLHLPHQPSHYKQLPRSHRPLGPQAPSRSRAQQPLPRTLPLLASNDKR